MEFYSLKVCTRKKTNLNSQQVLLKNNYNKSYNYNNKHHNNVK